MQSMRQAVSHIVLMAALLLSAVFPIQALDSAGNLSVAGFVETDFNNLRDTLFAVSQYTPTGLLNTNFASGGIATLPFHHGVAMDIATHVEGGVDKIVVVGTAIDPVAGLPRALIAKFIGSGPGAGSLDPSFNPGGAFFDGGDGIAWILPAPSIINGINITDPFYALCGSAILTIDPIFETRYRGFSIILASDGSSFGGPFSPFDAKFNATAFLPAVSIIPIIAGKRIVGGSPQPILTPGFGSADPIFTGDISGEFYDLAAGISLAIGEQHAYAVGRHATKGLLTKFTIDSTPSATLDTSFGSNGYVIAEIGNRQTTFDAVKVDTSSGIERIFVCGTARSLQTRMFVAEYDASGNLVSTFGENGIQTIFEGPNIQTIARDIVLPNFDLGSLPFGCPTGSSTGLFAIGAANGQSPLIANLSCSGGALKTEYGDKAIASLATEAKTSMTVLKQQEPTGNALPTPSSSPFNRIFNALEGNPFAVSLSAPGFVLQPGRYYIDVQAPLADTQSHQLALYNEPLDMIETVGDTIWNSSGILTKALLKTNLFVSESTRYFLQHYFAGTGLGFAAGLPANLSGLEEVYAQMNIQQL